VISRFGREHTKRAYPAGCDSMLAQIERDGLATAHNSQPPADLNLHRCRLFSLRAVDGLSGVSPRECISRFPVDAHGCDLSNCGIGGIMTRFQERLTMVNDMVGCGRVVGFVSHGGAPSTPSHVSTDTPHRRYS
jgi:hypothetical protein